MKYEVIGIVTITVELFDIEANSEEEAKKKAIEKIKESYNLSIIGYHHIPKDVDIDLDAYEYEYQ